MTDDQKLARFRFLLEKVNYKDWHIEAHADHSGHYLQVRFSATDTKTAAKTDWTGRKWRLSPHMTHSEVVSTALKAVLTAEEHEAREHFLYRGKAIFGPHIDVDSLWCVCDETDKRQPVSRASDPLAGFPE